MPQLLLKSNLPWDTALCFPAHRRKHKVNCFPIKQLHVSLMLFQVISLCRKWALFSKSAEVTRLRSFLGPGASHTSVGWAAVPSAVAPTHGARKKWNALDGGQAESPSKNTHQVKRNCQKPSFFSCTSTTYPAHRPTLTVGFSWWLHEMMCHIHPGSSLGSSSD